MMWYEWWYSKFYYVLGINDSYITPFEKKNPNMQVQYVTAAAPWEQQHIHLEGKYIYENAPLAEKAENNSL